MVQVQSCAPTVEAPTIWSMLAIKRKEKKEEKKPSKRASTAVFQDMLKQSAEPKREKKQRMKTRTRSKGVKAKPKLRMLLNAGDAAGTTTRQ